MKFLRSALVLVCAAGAAMMLYTTSCGGDADKSGGQQIETEITGKAELLCDESLYAFMQPTFPLFDSAYSQASVTVKPVSAREAMAQLFAGKSRGVIIARSYLRDEDSLMKAFKVAPHQAITFAQDGLVLYTKPGFPLDTIALDQLKKLLTDKSTTFKSLFPQLKAEPMLVCPEAASSEYGNILLMLTNGAAPHKLQFRKTGEEVRAEVEKNPNAIGIGYLSRLAGEATVKNVKLLRIGFQDSTGTYIKPKRVHQSTIVMGRYPLIVKIQGLLLEDRRTTLPWGFFTFLRSDTKAKEYYVKMGIMADSAIYNLIEKNDDEF